MSLTQGGGPLGRGSGETNYTFVSPAHKILFQPDERRLRALVGDTVVLDTAGAHLLHETGIRPVVYVPIGDFVAGLLERTDTTTHCPFKGVATYWSLRVGDELRADAVWAYERPLEEASWLSGFAALPFSAADAWMVEDEKIAGGLRDPYHRVDVHQSSRSVRVSVGDDVIAECARPVLVFETGMPVRAYVSRRDIVPGHMAPSRSRTTSPYMGEATYWHVQAGGGTFDDGAWSYELPLAEAMKIAGHVCIEADGIDVELG